MNSFPEGDDNFSIAPPLFRSCDARSEAVPESKRKSVFAPRLISGIRGWRGAALWAFIFLVGAITLANLTMTIILVVTLRLTPSHGFSSVLFGIEEYGFDSNWFASPFVSFLVPSSVRNLILSPSRNTPATISSFPLKDLQILANGATESFVTREIVARLRDSQSLDPEHPRSSLRLRDASFRVDADGFRWQESDGGVSKLNLGGEEGRIALSPSTRSMTTPSTVANSCSAPRESDLKLSADSGNVSLIGNEGVFVETRRATFKSQRGGDILFSVERKVEDRPWAGGHLVFDGRSVIFNIDKLKKASSDSPIGVGFKLCVCASNGRLFRVRVRSRADGCSNLSPINNPC